MRRIETFVSAQRRLELLYNKSVRYLEDQIITVMSDYGLNQITFQFSRISYTCSSHQDKEGTTYIIIKNTTTNNTFTVASNPDKCKHLFVYLLEEE